MSNAAFSTLPQIWADYEAGQNQPRMLNRCFANLAEVLARMLRGELRRGRHIIPDHAFDDLHQELLICAYEKDLPRFDPERGNLAAFLRRRIRWRLVDLFRSTRPDMAIDDVELDEVPATHDEVTAEGVLIDLEGERERRRAVEQLKGAALRIKDKRAKKAVWHYDVLGESMKQVGRRLRVHPSNAGRARQRGLAELRAAVPELAFAA